MIGAIDIGSNSVRLLLRQNGKTIFKNNIITGLALNMQGKLLDDEQIKGTAQAVAFFVSKAKESGAKEIFAFGTEALRKADNSNVFVDLVCSLCGVKVDIISGEKEAKLGLLGVLNGRDGGIIDIGGASTEIIVQKNGQVEYAKSLDVGVVVLKNNCNQEEFLLNDFCNKKVKEYGKIPNIKMYGIGGTITSVASMLQSLKEYDAEKVNGYIITRENLRKLKERIFSISLEDRENIVGLQKKRASVIAGGVLWLDKIMEYMNVNQIIASENDNLEGFLIDKGLYE